MRVCKQINCRLTERISVVRVCEHLAFNRNNQGHRYASQRPPGNGKIDVARIADLVPRLNGALPISYTQFPPKRKKNACKLLFRPRRSYPPARAIIFHPTSHCLWEPYIPPPNHTCKRDSSKFAPRENFRNIIFSTRALLSELWAHVARRRVARDFFTTSFFDSLLTVLFFFSTIYKRNNAKKIYE